MGLRTIISNFSHKGMLMPYDPPVEEIGHLLWLSEENV